MGRIFMGAGGVTRRGASSFDPATLAPDGWWEASYGGSPMLPRAPGDTHGSLAGNALVGAAVNGFTPANYEGANRALISQQASSNFVSVAGLTLICLFRWSLPLATDQIAWYSEPMIGGGDGGDFGMSISVSGVRGGNGAAVNTPRVALASGVWAMAALRVTGGNVLVRVSQPSGTTDVSGAVSITTIDSFLKFGRNWNDTVLFQGDFLSHLAFKRALSNAELTSMLSFYNARYPSIPALT